MSVSNLNGRLLEYLIVKEITDNHDCIIDDSTLKDQQRDIEKVKLVDEKILQKFKLSSTKIRIWLLNKIDLNNSKIIRHTDSSGIEGDVSDITIENKNLNQKINLSIKHNHLALKHQRPSSTPQQLGIPKKSNEDLLFRENYKRIFEEFRIKSLEINPTVNLYSEVVNIIPTSLYQPMCELVSDFINKYGNDNDKSNTFMRFIIGNTNFTKIVVNENDICFYKFQDLPNSLSMNSKLVSDKNIIVDFNNGIKVNMRIHTASSRFQTNSLKFDTQPYELEVPLERIQIIS